MDWTYPALTAISICAGFVDAVAGGGALITIYAGLPPAMAPGANKVQSACGTAMATWRYIAQGCLRCALPAVLVILVGATVGTPAVSPLMAEWLRLIVHTA